MQVRNLYEGREFLKYNGCMLFDGREFAKKKKVELANKLAQLERKLSIKSILVGDDPASVLYTKLKKVVAEEVGVEYKVLNFHASVSVQELTREIETTSEDGVMIQLPLPGALENEVGRVIRAIPLIKDVDGLRWEESGVKPATVRAVISIMDEIAKSERDLWEREMCVVGASGSVGRPLVHFINERGSAVNAVGRDTKESAKIVKESGVVISAVGSPGLIEEENVGNNVITIDVGIEMVDGRAVGDMEKSVYNRAVVAVPVPGGVGPVTIVSLMENLYELYTGPGD